MTSYDLTKSWRRAPPFEHSLTRAQTRLVDPRSGAGVPTSTGGTPTGYERASSRLTPNCSVWRPGSFSEFQAKERIPALICCLINKFPSKTWQKRAAVGRVNWPTRKKGFWKSMCGEWQSHKNYRQMKGGSQDGT